MSSVVPPSLADASAETPGSDDGWTRYRRVLGWLLVAALFAGLVATLTAGAKHESYDRLTTALETGEVTSVQVAGAPDWNKRGSGWAVAEIQWNEKALDRWAQVLTASSPAQVRAARVQGVTEEAVIGDLKTQLRDRQPGVEIGTAPFHPGAEFRGTFRAPWWVMFVAIVAVWGSLVQLAMGPMPWRATRAGWAWLVLFAPYVGVPAYLLLGGPTGAVGPPRAAKPLSGLTGFCLGIFLAGAGGALVTFI